MKGVKYILRFKTPNDTIQMIGSIDEIIDNIKLYLKNYNNITHIKINRHIIHNLHTRPQICNPILRELCELKKYEINKTS